MANININLDRAQPDPSGAPGVTGAAVDVDPELFQPPKGVGGPTTVNFRLVSSEPNRYKIAGLRYMNMSTDPSHDLFGQWFVPKNSPPEWRSPRWHDSGTQAWIYKSHDDTCITLEIERNNSGYVYVVEWEDTQTGEHHVCDPKIRNEP